MPGLIFKGGIQGEYCQRSLHQDSFFVSLIPSGCQSKLSRQSVFDCVNWLSDLIVTAFIYWMHFFFEGTLDSPSTHYRYLILLYFIFCALLVKTTRLLSAYSVCGNGGARVILKHHYLWEGSCTLFSMF